MLKRSPGSKVSGLPSSTIGLPEGSFLAGLIAAYSYPSRKIDLTRGLVLCEEERTLDGTPQESDVWTQATWLKSPFWFKQSLANFSSGLDAVVLIHLMVAGCCCCWLGTVSLTSSP